MADPVQIQNMDAKQIAELHIVERYLADQLSEEEAQAFEAYVEAHPEVTRDIENISRMKAGLAALRQRGELEGLVKKQRRVPLWAAFAASAAALLAIVVLPQYWSDSAATPLLAVTAEQLLGDNKQPLPIAGRFTIERARGLVDVMTSPAPEQAVEIRLDLNAEAASQRYSVELFRVSGAALTSLGNLPDATSQPDGSVSIFVRGSALLPGNYLIRATPTGGSEVAEFALQVQAR